MLQPSFNVTLFWVQILNSAEHLQVPSQIQRNRSINKIRTAIFTGGH